MSDESKPPYTIDTSKMLTIPANRFGINVNDADVSMYFGSYVNVAETERTDIHSHIVMSLGQFLVFAEQIASRSEVIKAMFEGAPLSIAKLPSDVVGRAWEAVLIDGKSAENEG